MSRIRRPSHATVVAYIALFVALSGGTTAVALNGANTVFTDDIANDTQPASGGNPAGGLAAADLRPSSVGSSEVANDSLTGADVNEPTFALGAKPWHEVGTPNQPPFLYADTSCRWRNYPDPRHNSVAFLRDQSGFVHLKGIVDFEGDTCPTGPGTLAIAARIFTLPPGYRPAKREVHAVLTADRLGRINIDGPEFRQEVGPGAVSISGNFEDFTNADVWLSLDGISFRCAPSGSNGCP